MDGGEGERGVEEGQLASRSEHDLDKDVKQDERWRNVSNIVAQFVKFTGRTDHRMSSSLLRLLIAYDRPS